MKKLFFFIALTSLAIPPAFAIDTPKCDGNQKVGELCACDISALHPTQSSVGLYEVKRKQLKINKLLGKKPKKLDDFLREKYEPVVVGPKNQLYITDHHHLARALWNEGVRTTYCKIELNLSAHPAANFWPEMKNRKLVYLHDENGKGPIDPSTLPQSVDQLKDDPYRSFAGRVREEGGYEKSKTPFNEFMWAQFFRARLPKPKNEAEFLQAMPKALELAKSSEAKALSGYVGESRE